MRLLRLVRRSLCFAIGPTLLTGIIACGPPEKAESPAPEGEPAAPASPQPGDLEAEVPNPPPPVFIDGIMAAPADAWPMFRGNSHLTGVSASDLPERLDVLWTYEAGDSFDSSAAIVGKTAYVPTFDGVMHAVNIDTGLVRWKTKILETGDVPLSVEDGAATTTASEEYGNPIVSSPTVRDGRVFFGDEYGYFHALDARTGEPLWRFETQTEIPSSPHWIDGGVLFGSYSEQLHYLNAETGEVIWEFQAEGPVHSTPGVAQGMAYISGCDGVVRAIDVKTGEQKHHINVGSYLGASPAYNDGHIYAGNFDNTIMSYDVENYTIEWIYDPEPKDFPFFSSAAITPDRIVLGGRDKIVHCIWRDTGEEIWRYATGGRVESSPAIIGNRVFVGSSDGNLFAFDLITGEVLWNFVIGGPIVASPAIAQGKLIIGTQDGILYCFGEKEGS